MRRYYRRHLGSVGIYILLLLAASWSLGPILFVAMSSFRSASEQFTTSTSLLPAELSLESYRHVLTTEAIPKGFLNSIVITTSATLLALLIGSPAGYSLSRHRTGGIAMSYMILVSRMIPPIALSIPLFVIGQRLDLVDTHVFMIVIYTFMNLALVTWMMKTFFDELPVELEEAARVDGCTTGQLLRKIVVPLAAPGMGASAVLSFVFTWNEFGLALALTRSDAVTLPVAISGFVTIFRWEWGWMAAASMLMVIPAIVFTIIAQKYIVQGLTFGAFK